MHNDVYTNFIYKMFLKKNSTRIQVQTKHAPFKKTVRKKQVECPQLSWYLPPRIPLLILSSGDCVYDNICFEYRTSLSCFYKFNCNTEHVEKFRVFCGSKSASYITKAPRYDVIKKFNPNNFTSSVCRKRFARLFRTFSSYIIKTYDVFMYRNPI